MPVDTHQSALCAVPLFDWQRQQKIQAVRTRRAELAERIRQWPRYSHRRIILEAQMEAVTAELLRLEHESDFMKETIHD